MVLPLQRLGGLVATLVCSIPQSAALNPFELDASQIANLQAVATAMKMPTAADGCTGMDQEPTDTEKDFAMNAYWKYFTYDTYDARSWVTLNDLESCLRSVPGGSVNPWVGADNLWEANQLIYKQLGDTMRPNLWWRQSWFEHNPVKNSDTVLGSSPGLTAPISNMSMEAWEQQPCNAFSNAAFFEISIQACKTASIQDFGDFSGTWPWKDEIIAAAALMAYGSFAMHGNPGSGRFHEESGKTSGSELNENESVSYDTAMMDRVSMDVLFFVFFQAIVRAVAVDPTDTVSLKPVLGLLKHPDLAPLNCDSMYCDARDSIHLYQQVLASPTENWHLVSDMRNGIPNYELASVGLVLVAIRAIMSDELFGSASMNLYTAVCSALTLSLMPNQDEAVWAESNYCNPGSDWYNAMKDNKWRVVKDIAKSLATLVTILESLIEGMFWQETLVGPSGYLDPYLKGVVNVSACWRQTHGNWHRVAAQMMKELMAFITTDVYEMSTVTITQAQKQEAWGSINLVVAEFMIFINGLKTMSAANTVNLCRVFKLAKEVGESGKLNLDWVIMPMMDAAGINSKITGLLREQDPISMDLGVDESVKDPTGACNYKFTNVMIDEVSGLSKLKLEDLAVAGEYLDSSTFEDTMIKFNMGLKTCPLHIHIKASAEFIKEGGKMGILCSKMTWRVEAELDVTFRVSDLIAWAQAGFQKLFSGADGALTAGVDLVNIDFDKVELSKFDITNFPGEAALKNLVNSLMKGRVLDELEKRLETKVHEAMQSAMDSAMSEVGSLLPGEEAERRRLQASQTCDAQDAMLVDSARPSALPFLVPAGLVALMLLQ